MPPRSARKSAARKMPSRAKKLSPQAAATLPPAVEESPSEVAAVKEEPAGEEVLASPQAVEAPEEGNALALESWGEVLVEVKTEELEVEDMAMREMESEEKVEGAVIVEKIGEAITTQEVSIGEAIAMREVEDEAMVMQDMKSGEKAEGAAIVEKIGEEFAAEVNGGGETASEKGGDSTVLPSESVEAPKDAYDSANDTDVDEAFIATVTGYPYLNPLSSLLLTIPLHLTTSSVVLAARRAPAAKGCQPCPPYLCSIGRTIADPSMPVSGRLPRVGSATLVGQLSEGARMGQPGQYLSYHSPPEETFSRFPIRVLKMRSCAEPSVCGERVSGNDPTERVSGKGLAGFCTREDLVERVNSGTNPRDLTERVNSSTNPGDLAEKVNSGTNPGDLAERVNSGTNPGDLVEKGHLFPGVGGSELGDPEASSSGASSGPPSPVDARVLRDLKVMKVDHDLDTAVIEGSLAVIRGRYSISAEYGLHVPRPGQRPCSSDAPDICISVDALEAGLRFPLHPLIKECLRWWRISPSQVAPNSWRYLVMFLGECRGVGIIPTRDLFMAAFRLCKSRGGYYLTARVGFQVSGAPSNNKGWKSRYLFVSGPVWGFRLDWSAHPIGNAPLVLIRGGVRRGRQTEGNPFLFMCDQGDDRALAGQGGSQPDL
ncbi:hypothetical protein BHM03_00054735 [Ensete ventricosum]|nr:hypothetical protein BHM03_00054735 [Ensete ventricosum]